MNSPRRRRGKATRPFAARQPSWQWTNGTVMQHLPFAHFMSAALLVAPAMVVPTRADDPPIRISGIYPHLAVFNDDKECGIGAVVPWAGRLWFLTYSPHKPNGSTDKLYTIGSDLNLAIRPESVGGTHANRMIHSESNQLIIGPYFIDAQANVRAVSPRKMSGRLTAVMRHLAHVPPAESQPHLRRGPRLVHRMAAYPRGRRRGAADGHARDVL